MDFLLVYASEQESRAWEINLVLPLTAMQIWLWEGFPFPHEHMVSAQPIGSITSGTAFVWLRVPL